MPATRRIATLKFEPRSAFSSRRRLTGLSFCVVVSEVLLRLRGIPLSFFDVPSEASDQRLAASIIGLRVFDVETAEPVLRYGFVLRAFDEAMGLGAPPDRQPGY